MPINLSLARKVYPESDETDFQFLERLPDAYKPFITVEDAKNKYFTRYFIRVVNDKNYIVEVDQRNYEVFKKNPRFVATTVVWQIVGKKETVKTPSGATIYGVEDFNRRSVSEADLTFGGLNKYITNYLEYWFSET